MSAQEFKPGDKVRCIETWTTHVIDSGDEFTVEETARVLTGIDAGSNRVFVQGEWVPARYFEKVGPEFVVGQQVSGDDYARLPVGTRVEDKYGPALVKVEDDAWRYADDRDAISYPSSDWSDTRTIARLPDDAEREDKADLYVEPEPLKEGDWCLVWVQVARAEPDDDGDLLFEAHSGSVVYEHPDAIVRPDAGQVPPWVKPAQCTSLHEQGHYLVRCTALGSHEAHRDGLAETWRDTEAYGRVEVES